MPVRSVKTCAQKNVQVIFSCQFSLYEFVNGVVKCEQLLIITSVITCTF